MEGKIGFHTFWNSKDSSGVFVRDTPAGNEDHADFVEAKLGFAFPSGSRKEYAVHYTYQGTLPTEFCGVIRAFIGSNTTSPNAGPRDLAYHRIDSNPYTIPPIREHYESWQGIGATHPNYEPGIDAHYIWGTPVWWFSGDFARAYVGNDIVIELKVDTLGFEGEFHCIGNCYYWNGFWVYDDEMGESGFDIAVAKYDGSVIHHEFSTVYPKGVPSSSNHFWWVSPCYGSPSNPGDILSKYGRYFWMTGGNVELSHVDNLFCAKSSAYAYYVDAETGITGKYRVASGGSSVPGSADLQGPDFADARILRIYHRGEALVARRNPDQKVRYRVYFPLAGDSADSTVSSSCSIAGISIEESESFSVLVNPVSESIEVLLAGMTPGDSWSLSVFDVSGRVAASSHGILEKNNQILGIDTEALTTGLYLLRVEAGGIEEVRNISIIH